VRHCTLIRGGVVIVDDLLVADSALERMRGLLGRSGLEHDQAMYIAPGNAIHTLWMKFAIDVAFVDRNLRIVMCRTNVVPWRCVAGGSGAYGVIEFAAGGLTAAGLVEGDELELG